MDLKKWSLKMLTLISLFIIWTSCSKDDEPELENISINAQDFSISLDENPISGAVLGNLEAIVDNDVDLSYSIKSQEVNGAFDLDSDGTLKVKDTSLFDFEVRQSISAKYQVRNGNVVDSADILISINDIDDLYILIEDFSTTIDEHPNNGQLIGEINIETNSSSSVSYELQDESVNGALLINDSGQLMVADSSAFIFDKNEEITATCIASVEGIRSSSLINISINDEDNTTSLIQTNALTSSIKENPNNGDLIGQLNVTHSDNSAVLTFSILEQSVQGAIAIDDVNIGEIVVADKIAFDYETHQQITAIYEVTDGTNSETDNITITIINDSNDDVALTANEFNVTIDENPKAGLVLGTVEASVTNTNSAISYSLEDNAVGAFSINSTSGEVSIADTSKFDYESSQQIRGVYKAVVNDSITATAYIVVDLNNVGEIEVSDFTTDIDENPSNGIVLGTVNATIDNGANMTYSLTDLSVSGAINIDLNSGELTVADPNSFDYETNTQITAVCEVIESNTTGTPISASITININDVDENVGELVGTEGFGTQARHVEIEIVNNLPVIAYHDYTNVKALSYNGTSWVSYGTNITGNTSGIHLVEANSDLYIAYPDPNTGSSMLKATVKKYDGTDWSAVGNVGFSPMNSSNVRFAVSGAGTPTVVYEENGIDDPNLQSYNSYYNNWNNPLESSSFGGIEGSEYTAGPDLAINPIENRWYVAYSVNSNSNKVRVKFWANFNNNGARWHSYGNLSGGSTNQNMIEFDSNGTLFILYKNGTDQKLYLESKSIGGSWSILGGAALSDSMREYDFKMINDTPYVVYEDATTYMLTLKKWNGSTWETVSEDFANGTYPDIAYDNSTSKVYVAYADNNHSQKLSVKKFDE